MAAVAPGLIDLHTHILPGIDDGARDLSEALAMARVALQEGIVCLAATPHSLRWPAGTNRAALEARAAALEQALRSQELPLTVVAGAETALLAALPWQIAAGEAIPLNRSRYLLLELPCVGPIPHLEEILFQVQARGLVPILAHPERAEGLASQHGRLRRLVQQGLLLQLTAGSLEGSFGPAVRRTAQRFLAEGLVQIIASDAHNAGGRAPRLRRAQELAARIVGPDRALAMVSTTPAAILADRPLEIEPPEGPRRRWFWWR